VVVASNCSIGHGTIIGSNAVVAEDIPDNVFAGGVPAKVISERKDSSPDVFSRFD